MATTSLWPIKSTISKTIDYVKNKDKTKIPLLDLAKTIDYAQNKDKTEEQYYVTGINCDSKNAYQEMMKVKRAYNKLNGIQGFHGYQSFKEGEITPEKAHKLGIQFANEMWGDDYQVVITTHLNTNHVHNHFVVNSVSFTNGKKYNYSNSEMARLRSTNDLICEEHNISHLEEKLTPRKHIDFNYYNYQNNYASKTKAIIDMAIKNSFSYNDFVKIMNDNDYEIINRYGKLSVKALNKNRNIRIERQFGSEYTFDRINERIIEEIPDKVSSDDFKKYNYYKTNYHNNKRSLIAMFLYYVFKIKTYNKYPRNYHISNEMRKESDKLDRYSLAVTFMSENHIDTREELYCFYELNKDMLNKMIYARKREYEIKSKTNNNELKEECDNKVSFYNEIIKELQEKVKTCKIIQDNQERINNELLTLDFNEKELKVL